jgi:predicted nucleotidyltransferase
MISHEELVLAREALLERTTSFFGAQPDVIGVFLAGSIPAGSADAYSDIDLRVVATSEGQARLLAKRLDSPAQWGDLLFNEWLDGTDHCVSHFRPFLKIDVFYLNPNTFTPSPWLKLPARVFLDRTGLVQDVLEHSRPLSFPLPAATEVSRILSKALAAAHETVRRARRGELFYAQSLLEELRMFLSRLDTWIHRFEPSAPSDLKMERRLSPTFKATLEGSYAGLNATAIEAAAVTLSEALAQQIPKLHAAFELGRSLAADLEAVNLVRARQVA